MARMTTSAGWSTPISRSSCSSPGAAAATAGFYPVPAPAVVNARLARTLFFGCRKVNGSPNDGVFQPGLIAHGADDQAARGHGLGRMRLPRRAPPPRSTWTPAPRPEPAGRPPHRFA